MGGEEIEIAVMETSDCQQRSQSPVRSSRGHVSQLKLAKYLERNQEMKTVVIAPPMNPSHVFLGESCVGDSARTLSAGTAARSTRLVRTRRGASPQQWTSD